MPSSAIADQQRISLAVGRRKGWNLLGKPSPRILGHYLIEALILCLNGKGSEINQSKCIDFDENS
jgi:hypothetical protein